MFISRLLCTQVKAVLVSPRRVMNIPTDTGNTILNILGIIFKDIHFTTYILFNCPVAPQKVLLQPPFYKYTKTEKYNNWPGSAEKLFFPELSPT